MSEPIIWGIHMPHELGLDPVNGSYVAIGWENMGDLASANHVLTKCAQRDWLGVSGNIECG